MNLRSDPSTLDPRKGGDVISTHMHFLLFEGLVRLHQDGSITPAQAKTFFISPDGLTYTFVLRGTQWSDGTPVTAQDFEKSWKNILDPNFPAPNAHLLYPIKNAEAAKKGIVSLSDVGIKSTDSHTLVITLEKPTPYFLDLISFCVFFPVPQHIDIAFPEWAYSANTHFVCNGPYCLKEWRHNNELIVEYNSNYWDQRHVRCDALKFYIIDNPMTALQMFENKELDVIGDPVSPLPIDALPALKKRGRLYMHPLAASTFITFNTDSPPFNNKKMRQALSYAINRAMIVANITQTGEIAALNAVPPILKNHRNLSFFPDGAVGKAKDLFEEALAECGITRAFFKQVTYHYSQTPLGQQIAQAIQQQWQDAFDIQIKLQSLDHKILMDKLIKRDYAIGQSIWVAQYLDPMNILERFKSKLNAKNYPNWENAEFAQLLDKSCYENGIERLATLEKAEEIFMEELPVCPLYHWGMAYMIQPHLHNVSMSLFGDLVFEHQTLRSKSAIQ